MTARRQFIATAAAIVCRLPWADRPGFLVSSLQTLVEFEMRRFVIEETDGVDIRAGMEDLVTANPTDQETIEATITLPLHGSHPFIINGSVVCRLRRIA